MILLINLASISISDAAVWVKLGENSTSKLMLDKQSVLQKDQLKKVWVKVDYKKLQKSAQVPDKEYNMAKLLWYFDCASQKSATSQVIQYNNEEVIYSASIDVKSAEFIEPVPESDVDIVMRQVCQPDKPAVNPANTGKAAAKADATAAKPGDANQKPVAVPPTPVAAVVPPKALPAKAIATKETGHGHEVHWTYEGKEGPANWGKLKPEFAVCHIGRNQTPINIDQTVDAPLKPLTGVQTFPAKDIFNNGHTVQANFQEGNTLVLDGTTFHLKQVHFHAPSENQIRGKSFPMEAHFVHADAKGNLAVIGVMYKEGAANSGLASLWAQMSDKVSEPTVLNNKVLMGDLMPENRSYFRFSGSLTTPPCSEGVRWLIIKTPMTVSKEQIKAFEKAVHHHNNRPLQPLNGRLVVE